MRVSYHLILFLLPQISEIQTYVIVPNGPRNIVTPYFAQMIRGTVSKNGLEDKAKGILDRDGKSLVVERVAFGLGAEPMPKFGVTGELTQSCIYLTSQQKCW